MPTRRLVVLAVAGALPLLAALAALFVLRDSGASSSAYRGSRPPEGYIAPTFRLRSYTGRDVRMDELRDKTVVLTFLDAQCQESCPVIAAAAPRARARLDPEDRARVALIAITTDPAEDTPAVVRSFLRRYRAEGALDYLVGPELELRRVWRDYGVLPSESSGSDDLHSAPVRIYAPGGEWVSTLSAAVELTPRNLAHDIQVAIDKSS